MRKIDYNKIMCVVAAILIICFVLCVTNDYINYDNINNSAPFYVYALVRTLQFILPSIILLYLYNQNTKVKESNYTVKSKKIPSSFNDYKIAHISDFHNTNSKRAKTTLVKKIEENKPDVIVITGDLVDSRRTNIDTAKEFVESVKHIAPIYYVLGNHESRLTNLPELENKMQNAGAIILRNKKIKLKKNSEFIELIGLDDPAFYTAQEDANEMKSKIDEKLKILEKTEDKFTILLTHRPEYIETYSNNKLDLVFTGHAHGGQIRLPFLGGIIAPGQGIFPKYTSGIYEVNNTKLVVSRGIGNSKFPFRINNRPEIIFVKLAH